MIKFKKLLSGLLVVATIATGISIFPATDAKAANQGTATLRILSTTDLHGQAGTLDYHKASDNKIGSLAQLSTLIKASKKEITNGNTLLVDSGDTAFGYLDHKILDGDLDYTEYMYSTMKYMGYDAITLGNHDFEFGIDFIKDQLSDAGMKDKVVLANVFDARTEKKIWAGSKVVTKKMKTTKNQDVEVKIGIIGVTPPMLLDTITDHTSDLMRKDMVSCVKSQVKVLQKKNVDMIVVLCHSGVGSAEYTDSGEAAAYEISKIPGVDAICAGHTHVNFPSNDPKVADYYNLPGVDSKGIMNGTSVVQTANAGVSLGQTDIKFKFVEDKDKKVTAKIVSKKVTIKYVDKNTKADSKITTYLAKYDKAAKKRFAEKIADVKVGSNNYFGMLEDTGAISLANEVKTRFALDYVQNNPGYENYKIVAASSYNLTGYSSKDDYINIKNTITEKDLLNIQMYNNEMVYLQAINGKKLKEWIEYSAASVYQTPQGDGTYVISDAFNKDWSKLKVFDGVEYEIDTTVAPKYDVNGNVINSTSRITSLTINGEPVKDDDKILAVFDRTNYSKAHPILGNIADKCLAQKRLRPNELFRDYIQESLDADGMYSLTCDDNWNLIFNQDTSYVLRSSSLSGSDASARNWYRGTEKTEDGYNYYNAVFTNKSEDISGPFVTYYRTKNIRTGNAYDVLIYATDKSGLEDVRVANGKTDESAWSSATKVKDGRFEVTHNGGYTIIAKDKKGNATVRYMDVTNIIPGCVEEPTVAYFSNFYKSISGTAKPGVKVFVDVQGVVSSTTAKEDGSFKCVIPYCAPADEDIMVWAENENGVKSDIVYAQAKRVGGNQPKATITNKDCILKGEFTDEKSCVIVAVDEGHIYYPESAKFSLVKESTVDETDKVYVKCKYKAGKTTYKLYIPYLNAGTSLELYNIDWCARDGKETIVKIEEVAPNMPVITKKIREGEEELEGYVPNYDGECTIVVKCGDKRFTTTTDYDGRFELEVKDLKEGDKLAIYAIDKVDGEKRTSKKAEVKVEKKKEQEENN